MPNTSLDFILKDILDYFASCAGNAQNGSAAFNRFNLYKDAISAVIKDRKGEKCQNWKPRELAEIGALVMNEDQIKLLKRALDTYMFFIEQNMGDKFNVDDSDGFFLMKEKLSEIIGVDVT